MIEIEINGQKIETQEGDSIIEAADKVGIHIPRFCYHAKLSVAASCRMCVVEVEKTGKPVPSCATPVTEGMKIHTKTKMVLEAQRNAMEFLLANHPLDCPICDQGGDCELQDLSMGYGKTHSHYNFPKRSVASKSLGPLIEPEMTRCIHCTRCVRFGEEIAGLRELGITHRGGDAEIGTYVKHCMQSELSGNVIDLCPVGALLAKPSLYSCRGWEAREYPTIAAHDCVGTNVFIHAKVQENPNQRPVLRVVPRNNEAINEMWMSDRDRFSYEGLAHKERIFKPLIKNGSKWELTTWENALQAITTRTNTMLKQNNAEQIAALASPNSTLEELYLLQKLMRSLGSHNIDYRVRESDFSDQAFPGLGMKISDIEDLSAILLVGSHVQTEQPLLSNWIRKASVINDAEVFAVNPIDYPSTFTKQSKIITADIITALAEIAKCLADESGEKYDKLSKVTPSDTAKNIAQKLKASKKSAVFMGSFAIHHPEASQIRSLLQIIAKLTQSTLGSFTDGANTAGAHLADALPHQTGRNAKALLTSDPAQAYFLLGLEPELDTAYPAAALKTLKSADLVVCLTPFATETMKTYANVILPISPFTQTAGTFVNGEGTWQSFDAVVAPEGESKPAWKVFRALAKKLSLSGFSYKTTQAICSEIKSQLKPQKISEEHNTDLKNLTLNTAQTTTKDLLRIASWPSYRVDNLVRRATALQEVSQNGLAYISINASLAKQLDFNLGDRVTATQEDSHVTLPIMIDNRLTDGTVLIPSGLEETAGFGQAMKTVALKKEAS